MKTKLSKTEKTRRQAWRDQALENHTVSKLSVEHEHTPKALRAKKNPRPEVTAPKKSGNPTVILADLFKGSTYTGLYVHVTHKQAFNARKAKRALKQTASDLANVAMETYADGSPVVCELGESAESIENRRREALTDRIDQAEEER